MSRVRMTLQPGARGTKELTAVFGERLVCVRYRKSDSGSTKTVEIVVDASLLALFRSAMTKRQNGYVQESALTEAAEIPRHPAEHLVARATDDAAHENDPSEGEHPCVCSALLRSRLRPRITFVFAAAENGAVVGMLGELPEVWAAGDTIPAARAGLIAELSLLLAANPAQARPALRPQRALRREIVLLPQRRRQ